MIPNELKILRLQSIVQLLTLIVFLIMSPIMAPALSTHEPGCNNNNIKLKSFYNTAAHGFLAVVNNTKVSTLPDNVYLYTINGAKTSAQFYIFDPNARMFICFKGKRFIPKLIPKPMKMCLFDEDIDKEKSGEIKLKVQNHTLNVSKKGRRPRHYKKFQYFISMCETSKPSIVDDLCKKLPPKVKRMMKTKKLVNCPA